MRPHIRSSTEYRRRSVAALDSLTSSDPTRRRSMNVTQSTGKGTRSMSLSTGPHADPKHSGDKSTHSQHDLKNIPGPGSPFSLSSIILRRSSLPARMTHSTRVVDRRKSSDLSVDPSQQELNIFRIKVLIVCFVVVLVIAMLISLLRFYGSK